MTAPTFIYGKGAIGFVGERFRLLRDGKPVPYIYLRDGLPRQCAHWLAMTGERRAVDNRPYNALR